MEILHTIILVLHVLGATFIVGSLFVAVFILSKNPVPRANAELLDKILKLVHWAIGIQILTGIYLMGSEWSDFRGNWMLWLKIGLLTLDGLVGGRIIGVRLTEALKSQKGDVDLHESSRLAWLALVIFLTITTLGVLVVETGA